MVDYLRLYAETFRLPIEPNARVTALSSAPYGYQLKTNRGAYQARQVVIATGPFQRPLVPAISQELSPEVYQVNSSEYKNPDQLPPGPVLVVGAGNSGAQIADELSTDREVILTASSRLSYLPQRFLGKHLFWWLYRLGLMEASVDSWIGRRLP